MSAPSIWTPETMSILSGLKLPIGCPLTVSMIAVFCGCASERLRVHYVHEPDRSDRRQLPLQIAGYVWNRASVFRPVPLLRTWRQSHNRMPLQEHRRHGDPQADRAATPEGCPSAQRVARHPGVVSIGSISYPGAEAVGCGHVSDCRRLLGAIEGKGFPCESAQPTNR